MVALIAVGALIGADEVAVTAAAKSVGGTSSAAPLFALWGAGSFVGGLIVTRLGTARSATGLVLWLGALAAGHLALIPADTSVLELAAVLLVAGAAIAPTEAAVYAMVEDAAPAGAITEAFAWLATAMAVGGAVGAAGAGALADSVGPAAAFALGGGAAVLAVLTTALRSRTLDCRKTSARERWTGGPPIVIPDMPEPICQTEGELCL